MDVQSDSPNDRYRMNDNTLLHRVVKPSWLVQNDIVSSQAFRPEPRDENLMSVFDGDQINAERAWQHYTGDPDKPLPPGVLSVTFAEFTDEGLPVCPDPDTFPEHVLVDYRGLGTNQIKRKSANLRDIAVRRGWQYRAPRQG